MGKTTPKDEKIVKKLTKTLTGKPLEIIDTTPTLEVTKEETGRAVVVAWGRMNPPTAGHEMLVNKVKSLAKTRGADAKVFLSHSQDKKKNPLSYLQKIKYAKKAFGKIVQVSDSRNIIDILKSLQDSYDSITIVVGSDRVNEFKSFTSKYNKKEYDFDQINVVSAGERDPDADDVSGMSASKLRDLAARGDIETFMKGLPSNIKDRDAESMYKDIRKGMSIKEDVDNDIEEARKTDTWKTITKILPHVQTASDKQKQAKERLEKNASEYKKITEVTPDTKNILPHEHHTALRRLNHLLRHMYGREKLQRRRIMDTDESVNEALTIAQRIKRKATIKKLKSRLERGRRIAKRRMAPKQKLEKRSRRKAIQLLKKRFSGGKDYRDMSPGEKIIVDKRIENKKKLITRLAKRLFPRVRKAEAERLALVRKADAIRNYQTVTAKPLQQIKSNGPATIQFNSYDYTSIKNKAVKNGINEELLISVFLRGIQLYNEKSTPNLTDKQFAFNRVNSFVAKGKAFYEDKDLFNLNYNQKKKVVIEKTVAQKNSVNEKIKTKIRERAISTLSKIRKN
jgi:nicotinic acid mononucleotide adenylyltransferase